LVGAVSVVEHAFGVQVGAALLHEPLARQVVAAEPDNV
jgi:hypothetical protein